MLCLSKGVPEFIRHKVAVHTQVAQMRLWAQVGINPCGPQDNLDIPESSTKKRRCCQPKRVEKKKQGPAWEDLKFRVHTVHSFSAKRLDALVDLVEKLGRVLSSPRHDGCRAARMSIHEF